MIKKMFIRFLLVFMVIAFLGVAVLQWFWIDNALQERENRFSSKIYDILNRVVYRIDQLNYMKYINDMKQQLGDMKNFQDIIASYNSSVSGQPQHPVGASTGVYDHLSFFAINIQGTQNGISVVREFVLSPPAVNIEKRVVDSINPAVFYERLQTLILRLMQESEPQNLSVEKLLQHVNIRSMLLRAFSEHGIPLHFKEEILNKEGVLNKAVDDNRKFYYVPLFPNEYVKKDYYLGVSFDTIMPVVLENMGWFFFASVFCIVGLLSVFIITIVIIMRQQKLSVIKNDFINNMTHEFKTPITTISLATSAITREKVMEDKMQLMKFNDIIREANGRMNKYVERILQQAKLDKKEVYLNKEDVDMNELVKNTAGHFILQAQERGGTLDIALEIENFFYYADEVHMQDVVNNLLDNALKYSPDPPEVRIYTKKNKEGYIIGVEDHGIGISKEAQKKVFKRFYRVPNGNLHDVKGFGLGLNYVKSIVELHNGFIRLTSKRNKGTLIEIILK